MEVRFHREVRVNWIRVGLPVDLTRLTAASGPEIYRGKKSALLPSAQSAREDRAAGKKFKKIKKPERHKLQARGDKDREAEEQVQSLRSDICAIGPLTLRSQSHWHIRKTLKVIFHRVAEEGGGGGGSVGRSGRRKYTNEQ